MRIACMYREGAANSYYRSQLPLRELHRLGHKLPTVSVEQMRHGDLRNAPFDLLHMQQAGETEHLELARRMHEYGIAVVWDTDDDISDLPRNTPLYRRHGGRRGMRARAERNVAIALEADVVTTSSEPLAQTYRAAGATDVEVLENQIADSDIGRWSKPPGSGVVIGWVGALEHVMDLKKIPIRRALARLLATHPDVYVTAIGVDVELDDARYTHHRQVPIDQLLRHERSFDIGIAPLIDRQFNRARSNVKLKEYAAAGACWAASPVGPYADMGAEQGGVLVSDGGWFEALDALVTDPTRRAQLTRNAATWVKGQTARRHVRSWEAAFKRAVKRARAG